MNAREAAPADYLTQLTSLRGIACMVVLIGHVIQVLNYRMPPAAPPVALLRRLLAGAFNAEGAVLVFFVLSGCVLSRSLRGFERAAWRPVASFYVRRLFRLYPLLWFSLLPAIASILAARGLAREGIFVGWLQRNLLSNFGIAHGLLSLSGFYTRFNGPMWSLRVELIYSALFPALFLALRAPRLRLPVLAGFALLATLPLPSFFGTAYGLAFALGALIPMLGFEDRRGGGPLLGVALIALIYDRLALGGLHPIENLYVIIETLAAFVLVRQVYHRGSRLRLLLAPPVVLLGEISFSVYLLHLPIFLLLLAGVSRFLAVTWLLTHPLVCQAGFSLLTIAVTVPVSLATYRLIELPLHAAGRRLAKRLGQPRAPAIALPAGMARPPVA